MPTSSSVFVDTSGWAEPHVGNSPDHDRMQRYYHYSRIEKRMRHR